MSTLVNTSAALVASPRPCAPVAGARPFADDAQPRLMNRLQTTVAAMAWRQLTGSTTRGHETAHRTAAQDGRTAIGGAYVTSKQHFSIRSGPPTSRPPA